MTRTPLLPTRTIVRPAEAADVPAMVALHRAGFGSGWTPAVWRSRYGAGAGPRARVVGAFDPDGRCLATFGGVLLRCRLGSVSALACRGGDVVVDPQLRASAAGARLLLRVCEAFFGGFEGSEVALVFGFPSPGLLRTLVGCCRFEVMADVQWLVRPTIGIAAPDGDLVVATADELPHDLDRVLAGAGAPPDAADGWGLVRDLGYLRWRYQDNPHGRYGVVTVRDAGGALRGAAIVRTDAPHDESVVVVEWFVPDRDRRVAAALLAAVAGIGREHGRPQIVICFAGSSPEFRTMQEEHGFRVSVSPYQFLFRPYRRNVTRSSLFDHWRFSAGDLDFF